jgi:hypothetical protein
VANFDFPSLSVEHRDLTGRAGLMVEQGGQHADLGGLPLPAAGLGHDREGDEPGCGVGQAFRLLVPGLAAAAGSHAAGLVQHDQLGAVRELADRLERDGLRGVLDAPGQVRAAGGEPQEAVHGEEAPVGEVQDPLGER